MIDERTVELLAERLVRRTEQANAYFLMKMGSSIKKIKSLKPNEARQLIQMLKYGSEYDDIIKQIARYTNLNVAEIDEIFANYAKKDQIFYKKFYNYRNIPFVPFDENPALKTQTMALANVAKNELYNFSRINVLGYSIKDTNGVVRFTGLRETYNRVLDEAMVNVSQGVETFDAAMTRVMKDIGGSGLKTLDFESGRSIRLDSMVRMHLQSRLRELHNENQKIIGEEIGFDGWEISVHINPAPDHENAQGHQFSIAEYEKLNSGEEAEDYEGEIITLDHDNKNGYRPISELNCYHKVFSIVLGVSEPEYSKKELQQIIDDNNKGFEFEGKHYTNYEGTQMQRTLERKIREQKDIQILAKASDNKELISEAQTKITQLTNKYREFNKISGLKPKMERMKVSGYHRVKTNNTVIDKTIIDKSKQIIKVDSKEDLLLKWNKKFENDNIEVKHILKAEPKLIDKQITQVDNLLNKYDFVKDNINKDYETNKLIMQVNTGDIMGENNYARFFGGHYIEFNEKYFKDDKLLYKNVNSKIEEGWWQKVDDTNYEIYPVTHEFGHLLEYKIIENIEHAKGYKGSLLRGDYTLGDLRIFKEISKQVPDIEKYVSGYGKSTARFEWFAETFTQMELGKETPITKALKKYIDEFMGGNYEYFR